ncbi:MAG: hypothetical protein ABIJ40_19300 [Bacteroidota bacterium]
MENTVIVKRHIGISSSDTEGARRATGVSDDRPNPEVTDRPKRRRYTEGYKRKVVEEVAVLRSSGEGQIGSYLRKEGIYYSMVMKWERHYSQQRSKVGRKQKSREDYEVEIQKLKKELKRAKKKLAKSELLIEIQKKISKMIQLDKQK